MNIRNRFINKNLCLTVFFFIMSGIILLSCSSGTEPDSFCADPCDIVSVNNGISIRQVDCMGDNIDSDGAFDRYGRSTRFKVIYENGSIEVKNVQYNSLGIALSYQILIKYESETITKTVTQSLSGGRVVDKNCN